MRETNFSIHCYLGYGQLEKICRRPLVHSLGKHGIVVEEVYPVGVYDEDGTKRGELAPHLFVEECLMVELKGSRIVASVKVGCGATAGLPAGLSH